MIRPVLLATCLLLGQSAGQTVFPTTANETEVPSMSPSNTTDETGAPSMSPSNSTDGTEAPSLAPSNTTDGTDAPSLAPSNTTDGTDAPSMAPSNTTDGVTEAPSMSPIDATEAPTSTSSPTDASTASPTPMNTTDEVIDDTDAPSSTPANDTNVNATNAPTGPTMAPVSAAPTISQAPYQDSASCEDTTSNPRCAVRNLTGSCCPTVDDWMLDCCGDKNITVESICQLNPTCAALNLTGACCPTIPTNKPNDTEPKWLDCCEAVPIECQEEGACKKYNSTLYLLERMNSESEESTSSTGRLSILPVATTSMLLLLAAIAL